MKSVLAAFLLFSIVISLPAQDTSIEIGTYNIRFFPCNQDGGMMKTYDINMSRPPSGAPTDTTALFALIKELGIELLGVQEIVDPPLFGAMAKRHLGDNYEFIFAPSKGWQKVGFLYDASRLKLVGEPVIHQEVTIGKVDRLRPALRAYFKTIPDGFDFHAIVVHLKASPRGYDQRVQQWQHLEKILMSLPNEERQDADIILLGDFNNVSKIRQEEFLPIINRNGYFWFGSESPDFVSSYWRPDWSKPELKGSAIDHIFISSDAKIEYVENSAMAGGICAPKKISIEGDFPDYYQNISDHCPVFATFRAFPDDD